jgi:hypothetical protein
MELFVAANYLFRQKQENDCTLLRWINLGTCKGPSQSTYERKLFACFVFVTLRSPKLEDFFSHS